jgi:hypothetical protein
MSLKRKIELSIPLECAERKLRPPFLEEEEEEEEDVWTVEMDSSRKRKSIIKLGE